MEATPTPPVRCPNCGHPATGHFCAYYGQRNEAIVLTWRSLTGSLLATIVGDNITGIKEHTARYGILYTLRMPVDAYGSEWMKSLTPGVTMTIKGIFMALLFRSLFRVGWLRAVWCFLFAQVVTLTGAALSISATLFMYLLIYCVIHYGF